MKNKNLTKKEVEVKLPSKYGDFNLSAYSLTGKDEVSLALVKGVWQDDESILVRIHSSCATGDVFGSLRCDCGFQFEEALEMIEKEGKGVLVYLNQEGRGIGLINKLKAYKLQEQGLDTVEANLKLGFKMDERDYAIGAQILQNLGISRVQLLTNNPSKSADLLKHGIDVVESVPLEIKSNKHNSSYLHTKRDKLGHKLNIR
jgi:3,4-dihydroxy 2-butanone 4-phosphate synthase / GTP cyclohydrolase II